jgi:carboxymethylenebutenolidase
MRAEPVFTSDIIGLTTTAPFSRRGFMTASASVAAGYTLAAGPSIATARPNRVSETRVASSP